MRTARLLVVLLVGVAAAAGAQDFSRIPVRTRELAPGRAR
jgi:hypothetical protein